MLSAAFPQTLMWTAFASSSNWHSVLSPSKPNNMKQTPWTEPSEALSHNKSFLRYIGASVILRDISLPTVH